VVISKFIDSLIHQLAGGSKSQAADTESAGTGIATSLEIVALK